MLSQKLTRITLKMTDFEEFDSVKRERERAMDTSQRPAVVPTSCSSCSRTEGWLHANILNTTGSIPTERIGGGIERRNPIRASTPDTPQN